MQRFLIATLCVLILIPVLTSAQIEKEAKSKQPDTKLEAFLAKKGKLVVKDFYQIGKISGRYGSKIEFEALVICEPGQES